MEKNHVKAVFSMGEVVFRTRGLNDNEKSLLVDAFNSLDIEDIDTRTLIVNLHSDLFNFVMK